MFFGAESVKQTKDYMNSERLTPFYLRLLRISAFYKIFIANVMLTLLWTGLAVWIARKFGSSHWKEPASIILTVALASILISYVLIRLALVPLEKLSTFMSSVAKGNFIARSPYHSIGDPRINECVNSLNRMLDALQDEKRRSKLLVRHIITAQEEERKRVARELHDETSQVLATLILGLEKLKMTMPDSLDRCVACKGDVDHLKVLTDRILVEVHRLSYNLRPSLLDDMGLEDALSWLFTEQLGKEKDIKVFFEAHGMGKRLPEELEISLFRIAQEAMTNIKKYAKASTVSVKLVQDSDWLRFEVSDDGIGFDTSQVPQDKVRHLGIFGMKERTELFGGRFDLKSTLGKGTRISVALPIPAPAPDTVVAND